MFRNPRTVAQQNPKKYRYAVVGWTLIVLGAMLCLTLIGAIIGLPLILVGVVFLVLRSRIKEDAMPTKRPQSFEKD